MDITFHQNWSATLHNKPPIDLAKDSNFNKQKNLGPWECSTGLLGL